MLYKYLASAIVLLCFVNGGLCKQIPSYINVCKRDPNTVSDCVVSAIESLRQKLIEGIPELDVPPLEPFYIPEINAVDGENSPIRAVGKDVKVSGGGNFTIKSLTVDLDTLTIRVRVRFPKLHFEGRYKLDIQLLVLPLKGEGTLNADAVKADAEFTLRAQIVVKDGVEYIKFTRLVTDINMKDYRIKLDGLFNGDKVLGQATNEALNQNREEFIKTTKPSLEKTVSKMLLNIANKVVDGLAYDEVLPKP